MKNNFDTRFFQKKKFENKTISKYFRNAIKDLGIAVRSKEPEVTFNFSYSALVKIGIVLISVCSYRVKSRIVKNGVNSIFNPAPESPSATRYGAGPSSRAKLATG